MAQDRGPRRQYQLTSGRQRGGRSPAREDRNKDDPYPGAKKIGIEGLSGMSKRQLIDAIRNH